MPIVSVKVIENFFTEEQKMTLVKGLTDAFYRATMEAVWPYIYVIVEEVKQSHWGLAGHLLPDPDFLINDFVPIVEDAADAFVVAYDLPRRRSRGTAT